MADAAELSPKEARIEQAADQAARVLSGEQVRPPRRTSLPHVLRQATRNAPLHSLAIAFLLGVIAARRR